MNSITTDFSKIANFFKTEYPLNQHGLDELFASLEVEHHKKGTILISTNKKEEKLRFLNHGIVREFYTKDSQEKNINFYIKPQFISDLLAFIHETPTHKNQECLTDIEILSIKKLPLFELLEKYQCGKSYIESSFQKLLKQKELFEYNRITKSPETLYQELFIYKPDWLQHIPQYHIASYLDITPETLSRIRKRIY